MNALYDLLDKNKSYKPIKKYKRDTVKYSMHKESIATLGANTKAEDIIKLPPGEDLMEWLAVHVVDYNILNVVYGQVAKDCTKESCPNMSAGKEVEYLWRDETASKSKPTSLPAKEYITNTLEWIQSLLDNEEIFPSSKNVPFPKNFQRTVKNVFKKIVRVYIHILYSHFKPVHTLGLEAHVNSSLKMIILFGIHFKVLPVKELEPLDGWMRKNMPNLNLKELKKKDK